MAKWKASVLFRIRFFFNSLNISDRIAITTFLLGVIVAVTLAVLSDVIKINPNKPTENSPDKIVKNINKSKLPFPAKFNKDQLYILITQFEDYIPHIESECFGRSLEKRIVDIAEKYNLPIHVYYEKKSLNSLSEAKNVQRFYNADLVLWGDILELPKDCSHGYVCFKSSPSDTLIKIAGGKILLEKLDLHYEKNISPYDITQGNFHINNEIFDNWLLSIYNIKVGTNNPDAYFINKSQPIAYQSESYIVLGDLYYGLKQYNKAEISYKRAIDLKKNNFLAYRKLSYINSCLGNFKEAVKNATFSIKLNSINPESYLYRGIAKTNLKNYKAALIDYKHSIKLDSQNALAYSYLGYNFAELKDKKNALYNYIIAKKLDSSNSYNYINIGNIMFRSKHYTEALFNYQRAIELEPKSIDLYLYIVELKYLLKDYNGVIDASKKASITNKNTEKEIYYFSARAKLKLKDFKGAIIDFDKFSKKEPYINESVYFDRGLAKFNIEDYENSIIDFNRVLSINTDHYLATNIYGYIKYGFENYTDALDAFNKSICLNNRESYIYYRRGQTRAKLEDYIGAIQDYNRAILLHTDADELPSIYLERGKAKVKIGKLEGARNDLFKFCQLKKNIISIIYAYIYFEDGDLFLLTITLLYFITYAIKKYR
ncbi:tetratricopeptide repeat protein [Spirosoma foliorum]|uniref:Tetratricopeptide repeat protein n=1 Tax=Spirosoma foliorum TaxID=2710596 RepID=A0A7G5H2R1_9BACT|nr:tetratricopeptide repeat protein [Spirosoma foliorum]QMW05403.1 tetratricopeptide repeat protein [Spirosoma foliorum]